MSKNDLKATLLLGIVFHILVYKKIPEDRDTLYQLNVVLQASYNFTIGKGDTNSLRGFSEQWGLIVDSWDDISANQIYSLIGKYSVQYLDKVKKIRKFTWQQLYDLVETKGSIFFEDIDPFVSKIEKFLSDKI